MTTRLSKSKIQTYMNCPQKYKFQFVDKVKVKIPLAMQEGLRIHSHLENYYKRINLNELLLSPRDEIHRALFEGQDEVQKQKLMYFCIWDMERARRLQEKGLPLKRYFFPVKTELRMQSKKYNTSGIVDRIDRLPDDTYAIYDYKTGKKKGISENNEIELILYYLMLKERAPNIKVSRLGIIYVEHKDPLVEMVPSESAIKKVIEIKTDVRSCIDMGLFYVKNDAEWCPCQYEHICPKFAKNG